MKKLYAGIPYRKITSLLLILISTVSISLSQTTVTIGAGSQTGTSANSATGDPGPMYRSSATSNFVYSRHHYLYTQAELAAAGITAGVNISKLAWNKDLAASTNSPCTFQIWIKNSTKTVVGAAGQNWVDLINGSTQVYNNTALNLPAPVQWHEFVFSTPLLYTGGAIEISVNFDISAGTSPWTSAGFSWKKDPINDRTLSFCNSTPPGATLPNLRTVRPQIQITYESASACTSPPTAGTSTVTPGSACIGTPLTLNLTGNSTGSGQTYQWQSSANAGGPWVDISPSQGSPLFNLTSPATSTWYRAAVTCSGNTQYSTPVQFIANAGLPGGTYTINADLPTAGTNYTSFNDAVAALSCGITGAITFNVVGSTAPYSEQVIIPQINGASATNTITFNGNGRSLRFLSTNTNERATLKLNGADHITFDSLNIFGLGSVTGEYGFTVHLINNADSNTFRKCRIEATEASTLTNFAAFVISSSATSATATGSALCDGNRIEDNTIVGGYYGITNVGSSAASNRDNLILRNVVRDFYSYGIYVNGTLSTIVDGNNISRPNRTAVALGTADGIGIYFTGLSSACRVNGNRVHSMLEGNVTGTNDLYGIYFTGVDPLSGLENIVSNNAIYNMRTNGDLYGLYNASSDNVYYHHNTISLDDASSTSTLLTRGFYQTTLAAGIELRNNLITIRRGGTGAMHGLYFNTATSTISSNFNDVLVIGTNANFGYNGTSQPTLAAWQLATSQDANSVSINPFYANLATNNLQPTSPTLNDLGTPVGILTDILGAARSATTPDIGAWEFTVGACSAPPTPGDATSSVSAPICPNELVTLGVANNSSGTGQTYQWQSSTTAGGTYTNISGSLTNPSFNINPTTTLWYRVAVTCSGNTTFSTPVQVLVNALFPAGTYTINNALPTTWPAGGVGSNFNSFNAAYDALRCGIAGPVIFNVVAGSGPYNEQLIMGQIQNTSATNTVTFNGNGATITYLSTNTNERAVIKFNGTDHFIFDSLTVVPQGTATTEYGIGFHLLNNADSNIIRNNTINLNNSSTSTNYAGIVSSVGASPTTTGSNLSDFNKIHNNRINGGYYGITMVGSTTESVRDNQITNNTIKDFYSYGIYISGNLNTRIEGNNISRPIRANTTTAYGIYITSLSQQLLISKNRIHNMFDALTTSTSTCAGIYFTGVDPLTGLENVVSNNAIYNLNNNGIQYGMYNSSSDNVLYYHNTINLDDAAATTTSDTYGWYQVTLASGIELRNNLITILRGGAGDKYCLFFSTATTTYTSNFNNLYRNAQNAYTGWNGANQATLANWQTATSQDANSVALVPFYTDAPNGNLEPRSPALDNKGTPIASITTDIDNETRSATTPDIGAWEFTVPPCAAPPVAGAATASPNTGMCIGSQIALNLAGNSFGAGQTYQWQFSTSASGPWTNLGNAMQFPDTTILATGTLYYRAVVTCSGNSVNSTPVLVTMNPPFPAGVYTINNTTPTTWPGAGVGSNFNSFVEAVAVMQCGISGPVTFNVAAGTYTEQVRMNRITGASNSARVTFQSANGNAASVILTYASTLAATNYTLMLDSASYITYRNMTINATNATNGRAISLTNTASYDSIVGNIVNVPASTATTTAVVGIHAEGLSGTNHTIKGNTVVGGSSGIYIAGASTTVVTRYNAVDSNLVNGSFQYGIYTSNYQFGSVSKNTVNVTAPRATTSYGIYLTNNDSAYVANDNRVNINNVTTTTYGLYLTGCVSSETVLGSVSNNRIIGLTGNTGNLYGLYQTATDDNRSFNNVINVQTTSATAYGMYSTGGTGGLFYYNNSVRNNSAAAGTTNIAAYFSHTSSTSGVVDIRNNVFTHSANGIAMYQGNTENIYSDYNMLHTAGATLVRAGTVNYATLQAWRNAENWDENSIVYAPAFAAGNELQPDVANANVWAMHGRGVQIVGNSADINGSPRPTTLTTGVPDLGAYEFLPTVNPPVLPATPAAPAAGSTQFFMFGTDTVQKITWNAASTVPTNVEVRRYSGIIPPGLAAGQQSMYFYTDVDYTGSAPTSFNLQQFYIDPWMRDIPAEPTVKMGRTVANGSWFVSSNSTVHTFYNTITEQNLSFLDKFTGMTDGVAPPDGTITTTDTSNRGRRFWVGYGHHSFFDANSQSMVLYLSAEQAANVTVKINGTNWQRNYAIPANTVRVSDLIPKTGLADARLRDEGLFNTGISIESDVPIVVYAHIYAGLNSGATMLLPTGTYGYEYTSLNSAQFYPTEGDGPHSWFYVIADKDSTLVQITPSQPTKGGRAPGVPFQVYLNKGQVYQVLGTYANIGGGFTGVDMSGSTVKSIPNASGKCYPIAMFSGSSRTSLCNDFGGDNLIQQMFPNQAWGTKYLTFGTAKSGAFPTTYNSNKWRILVKDPATVVRRNGVVINPATLVVPGNYYEFGITQGTGPSTASYIEADRPIMVAQYMLSLNGADCPGLAAPTGLSDPEMIFISPIEQGIKRAVFYNTNVSNIQANYINVIIPTAGLATLTIDGGSTFTDVFAHPQLAGYSCVRHNLPTAAGQHIIQSDSAFTAFTYGMGSEESYGYNAGTLVRNLTALPSFNNVFNVGNTSTYTCKGTPFRLSVQISVKPTQLVWQFSGVPNISPNANVTQNNPVPTDSVTINGKKFYIYTLAQQYTFNTVGNYNIPIQVFHPSIEGCNGSYEVMLSVAVLPAPVTDFTIAGTGCVGDAFTFNATTTTSNGTPTSQWNWQFGDATTGVGQSVTHTYAAAGTYNVTVRGIANDGCIGDTTKPVTVNPRPVVSVVEDTMNVCLNATATFTVQNPVTGATYNWYNVATGGTPIGTGVSFTTPTITAATNFWVEGVVNGCASVTRTRVTALLLPNLANPVAVVDSVSTNTIVFRWSAVPNALSYEVSRDNGATWQTPSSGPTGLTHTVTGLALGTQVTLIVRANGGCLPSISQPVTGQTRTDEVYIPNAFTPNGDGLNDVLRVYGNTIRQMRFMVFNQWGEKIFESTSQTVAWDGSHSGKPQPSGVYMYVCDITLNTGEKIQRKGAINLVR